MASLTNPLEIEPDYGTSWEGFYTWLTKQIIRKTRDLDQLAAVDQNSGSSLYLPTWVPDWRQPRSSPRFSTGNRHLPRKYSASGSSVVYINHDEDPTRLQLRGLRCDEIIRSDLSKAEIDNFLSQSSGGRTKSCLTTL